MSATPDDLYSPCPCGSGKKYKFCCYAQDKALGVKKKVQTSSTAGVYVTDPKAFGEHRWDSDTPDDLVLSDPKAFIGVSGEKKGKLDKIYEKALRYFHSNDQVEYKKAIHECLKIVPRSRLLHRELAITDYLLHDIDSALAASDTMITTCYDPSPADFAWRARLRYTRGDDAGADADLAEAMRLTPKTARDTSATCFLLALERQHEQIRDLCEKSPFKGHPDVMYYHGVALLNLGETEKTKKVLKAVSLNKCSFRLQVAEYLRMIEAGETPRTIFGDWRYHPVSHVYRPDLLRVEQVKAGFRHGRRIPSYNDRRWTIVVNEYIIEMDSSHEHCYEAIEQIALSKLPRAKDTILALAAHSWIGDIELKKYIIRLIYRLGIVKPGRTFQVRMPWQGQKVEVTMPVFSLYVKILFGPFWLIYKLLCAVNWVISYIQNNRLDRDFYAQYGKYAHPAPPEHAAQG